MNGHHSEALVFKVNGNTHKLFAMFFSIMSSLYIPQDNDFM